MAIKTYTTKAAYDAATKSTTESQVSLVEATREIFIDGVNIVTTEPTVGDVLFLDSSGEKVFVKGGDWLQKSVIPSSWTTVGYVFKRAGRKVSILDKSVTSLKYCAYAEYCISAISSADITIKLRLSNDYNSDTSINVTLDDDTLSDTNASLINEAIENACTSAGATNVPWCYYDSDAEKIYIVTNWNSWQQVYVGGTNCTIALSIWDDMPVSTAYFKANGKSTNYRGLMNLARGVTYWSTNGRTPSSTESTGVAGNVDPVTLDAFTNSNYCILLRSAYSSYEEYLEEEYMTMYPQKYGVFALDDADALTQAYGNRTVRLADSTTAYAFPALHYALTVGYSNTDLATGKWHLSGVEDGTVYMKDDVLALVAASQKKMGTTVLTNGAYRWFAQRYSSGSAWIFYGTYGTLFTNNVYSSSQCQAVLLLDI